MSSSWRNAPDKTKEDTKLFGLTRDKERREGGFGRNRDEGPPERRSIFSNNRGNDDRKTATFSSRDNDRVVWNRGGDRGSSGGGVFDKNFKDGPREGGRVFDRDTPRKREIPSSNEQVSE